ncbi:MAG: hypothetical protein ACLR4Z_04935 [Butyricicoccaceae bacterium]
MDFVLGAYLSKGGKELHLLLVHL